MPPPLKTKTARLYQAALLVPRLKAVWSPSPELLRNRHRITSEISQQLKPVDLRDDRDIAALTKALAARCFLKDSPHAILRRNYAFGGQ